MVIMSKYLMGESIRDILDHAYYYLCKKAVCTFRVLLILFYYVDISLVQVFFASFFTVKVRPYELRKVRYNRALWGASRKPLYILGCLLMGSLYILGGSSRMQTVVGVCINLVTLQVTGLRQHPRSWSLRSHEQKWF